MTLLSSARVARHGTTLSLLRRAKASVRNKKIKSAPKDLIMALVDVAKALIKGEISMSGRQLSAVKRNERNFRNLVNPSTSVETKKKTLQKGGFLGALLGPLAKIGVPIIGKLMGGLFGNNG